MNSALEIQSLALKLPQRSRLKLAGELLRNATPSTSSEDIINEATRRDAELESRKVSPLTESEFWAGILSFRSPPKAVSMMEN